MALKKNLLESLPQNPGIYKMKDAEGRVLYVGKAKSLKNRVKSYFQKDYAHSTRTRKLLQHAMDLEFVQTDSELEALVLENNLIKELRPKYNILMKDDKSYCYIKIDMGEDFPRIRVVREREMNAERAAGKKQSGVRYFGPQLASSKVYETLRVLKKLFPFRHCQLDIKWNQGSKESKNQPNLIFSPDKKLVEVTNRVIDFPCLDYFIKRCPGPCIGAVSPVEYKKVIQQIINFLEGKSDALETSLRGQMMEAASQKLFEKAAKLRDKLSAIASITEHQKVSDPHRQDTDIINFVIDMGHIYFTIFMIRGGKLLHQENFVLDALELSPHEGALEINEILDSFLTQYYEKAADIPREVLIPEDVENHTMLETWLTERINKKVIILTPQRGEKNKLLELCMKNATSFAKQSRIKWLAAEQNATAVTRLADVLNLDAKKLNRIEGYDISHLGGNETVGSMVVFEKGISKSSDYRHFKMRTVQGKPDDYKSMEEVLTRRFKYLTAPTKDVSVKKAAKKNSDVIKEWGIKLKWQELMEKPDIKDFYLLWEKKKPIGMARLIEVKAGIFMSEAIYILPEFRGGLLSYFFMQKLIEKIKNKKARLYISVENHLLNHWMQFGFDEVRAAPEEVVARNTFFEKLDNTTYKILAYYRAKKKKADPSFSAKPDLVVIDGGKGQLSTVVSVMKKLKLEKIPVISLAKRLEEIFTPGERAPILLQQGDEALKLLQRIRDESHRFAITFQRNLHAKAIFK